MAANDLTVWGIGTARTMRVHWMLMELGLEYDYRPIGSRTGETMTDEFLKLNPKHKIPVLEHGGLVLTESAAIIAYLGDAFDPPAPFYVPADARERGTLNEWCYFIMMELDAHPLYLIRRHGDLTHIYGEAPHAVESAKKYFADQLGAMMKKFGDAREFLMPGGMSIADILMVTSISFSQLYDLPLPAPLTAYYQRLTQRPAYRLAYERNHPGS